MGCSSTRELTPINKNPNTLNRSKQQYQLLIENKDDIIKHYKISSQIASGTYGKVKIAYNLNTNKKRAVKIISKSLLRRSKEKGIHNEIHILSILDHPNIIKILEYFQDNINYYLILELASGETLFSHIHKKGPLDEITSKRILVQILSSLNYIHSKGIVHRDLKPENIIVDLDDDLTVKIVDFGAGAFILNGKKLSDVVGSNYYIAPEVLKQKYDYKCDMWSFGVIMYLMLIGVPPFVGNDFREIHSGILNSTIDFDCIKKLSDDGKSLLKGLLERDVNKRFTSREALKHKWFEELKQIEIQRDKVVCIVKNLRNFRVEDTREYLVLAYIVRHGNIGNESLLRKFFLYMDREFRGVISYDEFKYTLGEYLDIEEIKESELEIIFSYLDQDKDGFFTYEEFLRCAIDKLYITSIQNTNYINSILKQADKSSQHQSPTHLKNLIKPSSSTSSLKHHNTISPKPIDFN